MSDYQPSHADEAQDELLCQHRKPATLGFVRGIARTIQKLEDDARDIRTGRSVADAIGVQLDIMGQIVGEERGGLLDDDYRAFIRTRILANKCHGYADEILQIWKRVTETNYFVQLFEHKPMAYTLAVARETPMNAARLARVHSMMETVRPAGYDGAHVEATGNAFRFDLGPAFDMGELARRI